MKEMAPCAPRNQEGKDNNKEILCTPQSQTQADGLRDAEGETYRFLEENSGVRVIYHPSKRGYGVPMSLILHSELVRGESICSAAPARILSTYKQD